MLPNFILEEIKRREEKERKQDLERPRVYIYEEMPINRYIPKKPEGPEDSDRGVYEIQILNSVNDYMVKFQ